MPEHGRPERSRHRGGFAAAVAILAALPFPSAAQTGAPAPAQSKGSWSTTETPATCEKAEFEAVVDGAAQTLREIQQKHTPVFQAKLRALKEKRGWTHEQFLKEAARFVRDEKIAEFDEMSERLLIEINSTGDGGGAKPNCAVLVKLRSAMAALVETQNAKWAYMFREVETALAK